MKPKLLFLILITFVGIPTYAQQIVFTPQWTPHSQFAGYHVAQEMGFYKDAGVDVVIDHTSTSDLVMNRLLKGKCNAITMTLFDAIYHIDHGAEIVNVLQTAQRSGHVIVVRDDNIRNIEQLRGKRVGIWRSSFSQLVQLMDLDYDLGIEWIKFIQSINLYISGAIDATMAMTYNELYWIRSSGFEDMIIRKKACTYLLNIMRSILKRHGLLQKLRVVDGNGLMNIRNRLWILSWK